MDNLFDLSEAAANFMMNGFAIDEKNPMVSSRSFLHDVWF